MYSNIPSSPDDQSHHSSSSSHHHLQKKKRVGKACDSCRIKKTKCDGKKPCNKCTQDNKICVFTEKKKVRDKSHPSGYVDLLETRLDLLTQAFDKVIRLAAPQVGFLNELVESAGADGDSVVPINKVIHYLITEQGLLKNLPLEWENGALIAANFNPNDIESASRKFANHKMNVHSEDTQRSPIKEELDDNFDGNLDVQVDVDVDVDNNLDDFKDEFDDLNHNNLKFDHLLKGYSGGGFVLANSATLNDGMSNDFSDFESDSNSVYSSAHPPESSSIGPSDTVSQPMSPSVKTPSLFGTNDSGLFHHPNGSSSSLTSNQLHTPANLSPSNTVDGLPTSRPEMVRRSSSIVTRSRSPSHQKLKSMGHVHKPIYSSTHHSSHNMASPGNASLTHSRTNSYTGDASAKSILLDNDFSLPSESIKMSELSYDDNMLGGL
ncbi:Fluconazole resistance protein 1 [Yamadazyma tenuis]|uniref:Zn(2)-C6 fungal-type domain-containing protein n=1 Tax=Candida tenuis (strain ATCC 10573 / BCRC 21748 / CBS 615 / JCM 9827 / NBRC 10315 / NRRL Y-1498 / VKM Y-70) TaxID=590646 RepID=G3B3A6_CANTC|nr:uncharacterized protein CANTEDRAFT_134697 [Yamadazyma tenuis ATCC 10573]XP_006686438.1 uncharacterized protein CANTEDRAFT_134697 [Yamadazyma tenuis ATCC 10573]EGV64123.1 hypothetical protein CANTEDRAFT_134697 [Yamadazyma tenuis ATCC 10573]EGV64124.1 hypothetical protein CANTEDRAFT_134697 [Yamadazyma tenuis ATCC 10573]WEJ96241.1 Fluconazole resistance protein 1 [Yamadazyma tenuis]